MFNGNAWNRHQRFCERITDPSNMANGGERKGEASTDVDFVGHIIPEKWLEVLVFCHSQETSREGRKAKSEWD